jgi:uncharacterized protein (DUF58 family)
LILGAILNTSWLVIGSTSVMIILIFANLLKKQTLNRIHYKRTFLYSRGFPGEKIDVNIHIENDKFIPVSWIQTIDSWPSSIAPVQQDSYSPSHLLNHGFLTNTYSLRAHEDKKRTYQLNLRARGIYRIGPVDVESTDLFGFYSTKTTMDNCDYVTVYPDIKPLPKYGLKTEDPFGLEKSKRRIFEDPIQTIGIRSYHPEDDLKRIHWNATARTGQMQVKISQPVSEKVVVVSLNVSGAPRSWEGTNFRQLEHLINISASTIYEVFNQGYAVGLISNGSQAYSDQPSRILPGKSRKQLPALLQALAGITQFTAGPFETFLFINASRIPYGSTLIVITSLITPQLIEVLSRLRKYHLNTTILYTGDENIPDITTARILPIPLQKEIPSS